MKSLDLLETIGSIRNKYILEAHSQTGTPKKRIPSKLLFLIAAIIALMLLLVGCVAYILGLKDMYLGEYTYDAGFEETCVSNSISLQGFAGTPNYQAAKEWQDYLSTRDPSAPDVIPGYESPMEYMAYRQMADIKKDGTFHYSGGASNHGTARLQFGDFGWEYVIIGGVEETDSVTSFYWNGEPVSEDVFWVCFEAQSEKENVEWHPYPDNTQPFDIDDSPGG